MMKLSPLRLRLALLSTLLSGVVMVMFGAAAWWTVSKQKSDALDARIRALGTRQPGWMFQNRDFQRLEENFGFVVTTPGEAAPYFLLVADGKGKVLHQSQDWPQGVAVDGLVKPMADGKEVAEPTEEMERPGWGRGPGQGRGRGPGGGGGQSVRFTKEPEFSTLRADRRIWRVGRMGNDDLTLVIGLSADATEAELRQLRNAAAIALPAALSLIGLGGWFVAGRALRPLQRIAETASLVTARGLDKRVPDLGGDPEITRLVAMLNDMMDRLEAGFHQATRFSADASHELKTPLAIMRGEIEQAIAMATPGSPEQRTLNSLLEEAHRLGGIVRSLLLLSRADAGSLVTTYEAVDLTGLVGELVEDAAASAETSGIRIQSAIAPGILVSGDASLLRTAIVNLLGNAIKHNQPEGIVRVDLTEKNNAAYVEIANSGPSIAAEEREAIFDRFSRGRAARDAAREGTGLGLSLAREIITAHGGALVLADETSDGLTRFVAMIPLTNLGGSDLNHQA
jgi:signal transduction histidine kinase